MRDTCKISHIFKILRTRAWKMTPFFDFVNSHLPSKNIPSLRENGTNVVEGTETIPVRL